MTTLTQRCIQMDNKLLNYTPCTCGGAIRLTRNVSQLRTPGTVRDTVTTQSWIYVKHYFDSSISPIIINQPINRRQ